LFDCSRRNSRLLALLISAGVAGALAVPAGLSSADASHASGQPAAAHTTAHASQASQQKATTEVKRKPRFPGHRPGRVYLGMSCGVRCHQKIPQLNRNFGVHRWFKKWGNWNGVAEAIREDRRNHRLPWISIEGPNHGAPTGWRGVGRGQYDRDIRALARTVRANDKKPMFISFDHEPSNKAPTSQGHWWANGYTHFYDELKRAHALRHVAFAPIMAGWLFSKYNHEDKPNDWLTPGVLRRAPFLGVDIYQNDKGTPYGKRLPGIARWLARHGHPHMMLGVGETGATNGLGAVSAATWLNRSLRWAAHHPARVVAISYFNSTAYSHTYWPLDESARKMAVFRKWLMTYPFINHVR
jgi:hypothetical protein